MYPVLLDISGRLCVVIGGGEVAERKVKGLLAAEATVRVVSPEITGELALLARQGMIEWRRKTYTDDDLDGAILVFAATSDREVQEMIVRRANANGQLLNVADDPASCTFQVPATHRQGDLTMTVSTGGTSPAVAAMIRRQLEEAYGAEYDFLLRLMAMVREMTAAEGEDTSQEERKKIYKKILHNDIIQWIRTGRIDRLREHLRDVLGSEMELDATLPELKR
ncbi:MAG: bifunctional precorrin-2 dehydrogenase/sirohydrochlorin ferrochelatase [Desulfobulbaceae bacterium]